MYGPKENNAETKREKKETKKEKRKFVVVLLWKVSKGAFSMDGIGARVPWPGGRRLFAV